MPILIRASTQPDYNQVKNKFKAAAGKLREKKRETMRVLGRKLVAELQKQAPKGKTGKFAKDHSFRTFEHGDTIELKVYFPKPLGAYIRFGTKPHQIRAKNKKALYFFWPKAGRFVVVPKAGGFKTHVSGDDKLWIGKGFVWHPGTKPNRYDLRAMSKWRPVAIVELKKMSRNFLIELKD